MTVSVIVVSYKPSTWLERCLASVVDQADQVVVVDNGSAGGEASTIGRRFDATVVGLSTNTGFAPGVNAGLGAATGDVVALLNDDAVAEPGWLASAGAALAGDSGLAAVGPKLLLAHRYAEIRLDQLPFWAPGDPRPLGRRLRSASVGAVDVLAGLLGRGVHRIEHDGGEVWRWTAGFGPIFVPIPPGYDESNVRIDGEPVAVVRTVDLVNNAGSYLSVEGFGGDIGYEAPDDGDFDQPADRFGVCGGAMVMPMDAVRRIGPMAASFFAYYEDTDWCWRAQLAGLRIRYQPSAVVRHARWGTSGGPTAALPALLAARNRVLCLIRNAPPAIYTAQVAEALGHSEPAGLRRSLARRVARARAERVVLSRRWQADPDEIWTRWAGVNDRWNEGMTPPAPS
ncbi:MAG: hypothetical protein QOG64_1989 [Acidimicrobiaceae bacterium]|nr:hypothetical protein [Acidimicrobiaceae bacterium]